MFWGGVRIPRDYRANDRIRVPEVRLVDEAGFAPGVAKTAAESLAQEQEAFLIKERGELAIVRKENS